MGDYNLAGLHARAFEHIVQSLALKLVTPGLRIFGDGKDGGREASYDGPMAYPSPENGWDGYLVIQAKFLQRPGKVGDQGAWALSQLKDELEKYTNPSNTSRRPDFYIFATNVVLTPVNGSGTIDKAEEMLRNYADKIGIKGHSIWHYDTICRYLDGQEEIRRAYSHLLTPGDIFARILEIMPGTRPNFGSMIADFLQKQLVADRHVRLGQAGYAAEDKTPLAKVFFDLPVGHERLSEPPADLARLGPELNAGFAAQLLDEAMQRLDYRSIAESSKGSSENVGGGPLTLPGVVGGQAPPNRGRYVLLGGPGQGKTTISMYLCQLHRAALLAGRPDHSLTPEAQRTIADIRNQCERDEVDFKRARRYPVRIELNRLADELARGETNSILGHLVKTVNRVTDGDLTANDLRAWLAEYPWLLVLDGLDEIPASSNRPALIAAIEDFESVVASCNADVLILATTRPQGYGKEFSPIDFQHMYLTPLTPSQALRYARRLVDVQFPADADGHNRVYERLERASREPITNRLMRSPLQVTIMAQLVERIGDPPGQRWLLFRKYFDVIYEREMTKGGAVTSLLREYPSLVKTVHYRAGLRLQVDSGLAGGSEALLAREEFEALVKSRIIELGHEPQEIGPLASRIITAAEERLVFLVEPIGGRIGFEIRSLQEFMASEALMDGTEDQIKSRLDTVALSAHWRNTFLFAAGRWVDGREHAFDGLLSICGKINESGSHEALTLAGSRLALDLAEDGLAREYPIHQRMLSRISLRLLSLPPGDWVRRLVDLMTPGIRRVYLEEIAGRLKHSDVYAQLGAWAVLYCLSNSGDREARELFDDHWPSDASHQLEICRMLLKCKIGELAAPIPALVPKVSLRRLREAEVLESFHDGELASLPAWFAALTQSGKSGNRGRRSIDLPVQIGQMTECRLQLVSVGDGPRQTLSALADMPAPIPSWSPLMAAARFVGMPSAKTLSDALHAAAKAWGRLDGEVTIPIGQIPWPLSECLSACHTSEEFERLAEKAESGELGDADAWLEAEALWTICDEATIAALTDDRWPFDSETIRKGPPFRATAVLISFPVNPESSIDELLALRGGMPASRLRSELSEMVLLRGPSWSNSRVNPRPTARELLQLTRDGERPKFDLNIFSNVVFGEEPDSAWIELFDTIVIGSRLKGRALANNKLGEFIAGLMENNPGRPSLVKLLGGLVMIGYDVPVIPPLPSPQDQEDLFLVVCDLILRLIRLDQGHEEAAHLGEVARSVIRRDAEVTDTILKILLQRQRKDWAAVVVERMLEVWPGKQWTTKRDALSWLHECVQGQESKIAAPGRWHELGLPDLREFKWR